MIRQTTKGQQTPKLDTLTYLTHTHKPTYRLMKMCWGGQENISYRVYNILFIFVIVFVSYKQDLVEHMFSRHKIGRKNIKTNK